MTNRKEVLVSHNGIPTTWPGRIELWLVGDRYEIRGGRESFDEGHPAFESLLDEATMYEGDYMAARAEKVASTKCGLELWKVRQGDEVRHEVRTPNGFIYPDHSIMFRQFAPAFSIIPLAVFGLPN